MDQMDVPQQPYFAALARLIEELGDAGAPLPRGTRAVLETAEAAGDIAAAEAALEHHVLATVRLDRHGYGATYRGGASPELVEKGWRTHLVRVMNPSHHQRPLLVSTTAGSTGGMNVTPATMSVPHSLSQKAFMFDRPHKAPWIRTMWIDQNVSDRPLSGLGIEYRLLHLYSRDRGDRSAYLAFSTHDDGGAVRSGRQGVDTVFSCLPSRSITLSIQDERGRGCVASLHIEDEQGRTLPPQSMRLAPDLRFQPQVYRGDGETLVLPDGRYWITARRGPEYLATRRMVDVSGDDQVLEIRLQRWIDPGEHGWYAGEMHIHAAGCSHYEIPTEGVGPETMIRQVRGEALSAASVLTWGPGYYHQRQFFTGEAISPPAVLEEPELQVASSASWRTAETETDHESHIRYDLEVSGFPSSHSGHLVLVKLSDQDYPGAQVIEDWPSWNLPVLRWAKAQGAITGYAHCSSGMAVDTDELPNLRMPRFDSIGFNEAIIDVCHGVVDFVSGGEAPPAQELNAWYHLLNCGYAVAMVGETDYPCISDDRPGLARTYVQLAEPPLDAAGFDCWLEAVRDGRLYFGDGRAHVLELTVASSDGPRVELNNPTTVEVRATVSAWLEPEVTAQTEEIRDSPGFTHQPWHLERARIGDSRSVPVELVLNGRVVAATTVVADGRPCMLRFEVEVERSSWLALRMLPSVHSNPVVVRVAGAPVRASRRSAQWCRDAVDVIWAEKHEYIHPEERAEAAAAYDHARRSYELIAAEALDD